MRTVLDVRPRMMQLYGRAVVEIVLHVRLLLLLMLLEMLL